MPKSSISYLTPSTLTPPEYGLDLLGVLEEGPFGYLKYQVIRLKSAFPRRKFQLLEKSAGSGPARLRGSRLRSKVVRSGSVPATPLPGGRPPS